MNLSNIQNEQLIPIVISQSKSLSRQIKNKFHRKNVDRYFRIITSQSGKILASISQQGQLTIYDFSGINLQNNTNNNFQIQSFTENNVLHISFSQDQQLFAISTTRPSIKLFQITKNVSTSNQQTQNTYSIKSLLQITNEPKTNSSSYGWIAWTPFSKNQFFYIKNSQLSLIKFQRTKNQSNFNTSTSSQTITYQSIPLAVSNTNSSSSTNNTILPPTSIKQSCDPYYLIYDRSYNNLISSSKSGAICLYKINSFNLDLVKNSSYTSFKNKTEIQRFQSIKIGKNLVIRDFSQTQKSILISTGIIQNSGNYLYDSYILSKKKLSTQQLLGYNKFTLNSQFLYFKLLVPGPVLLTENYYNYILAFIKGERYLYIFNDSENNSSQSIQTINPIQRIQMPYFLHSIHFNKVSNSTVFGIAQNQDKLVLMDFKFNCSNIFSKTENNINQNKAQLKFQCNSQCSSFLGNLYEFSFIKGKCVPKNNLIYQQQKKCKTMNSYKWNILLQTCEINCQSINHSISSNIWNIQDPRCSCQTPSIWYSDKSKCLTSDQIDKIYRQNQIERINRQNSTDPNNKNNNQIQRPPIPNNNNNNQNQNQKPSSPTGAIIVLVLFLILILISGIVLIYAYYKKKWCFNKKSPYVEDNQLKEYEIKAQKLPQMNHRFNENQIQTNQELLSQRPVMSQINNHLFNIVDEEQKQQKMTEKIQRKIQEYQNDKKQENKSKIQEQKNKQYKVQTQEIEEIEQIVISELDEL